MKSTWTAENANSKLNEIKNSADSDRIEILDGIRRNLKDWAAENFRLTPNQEACRQMLPREYWEETGFMLAHAIEKNYPIEITVSPGDIPPDQIERKDTGEVGWNQKSGFTVGYKFHF